MATRIEQALLDEMIDHARRRWPQECCGLLLGRRCGLVTSVTRVAPARNITREDPRRSYQIDWDCLLQAQRACRHGEDELIGFYHSHPDGSTRPSPRDLRDAWTEQVYLIISVESGRPCAVTAWRRHGDQSAFVEEPLRVTGVSSYSAVPVAATHTRR